MPKNHLTHAFFDFKIKKIITMKRKQSQTIFDHAVKQCKFLTIFSYPASIKDTLFELWASN